MPRRSNLSGKAFGPTVIIGTIGEDPHVIGIKLISRTLVDAGFNVILLGAKNSPEAFVRAAVEEDAKAILISSLSGHGEIHCRGFRERCREAGLEDDLLLYVGGNVVVGRLDWSYVERTFKEMGFDRVYPPGTSPFQAVEDLKRDLGWNGPAQTAISDTSF